MQVAFAPALTAKLSSTAKTLQGDVPCAHAQVKFWRDMKRDSDEDDAAHQALGAKLADDYPGHLPLLAARVASLAALTGDKRAARLQARRLFWLHALSRSISPPPLAQRTLSEAALTLLQVPLVP